MIKKERFHSDKEPPTISLTAGTVLFHKKPLNISFFKQLITDFYQPEFSCAIIAKSEPMTHTGYLTSYHIAAGSLDTVSYYFMRL